MGTELVKPTDTDIVSPKPQRRRFSPEYKRRVVEEVLTGRDSVSVVARRYDINANQLFRWKREYLGKEPGGATKEGLLPVQISALPEAGGVADPEPTGRIDIALGAGRRITVHGEVPKATLQTVLAVLSR